MRLPEVNLGFPYIHTEGREGRRRRGGRGEREAKQVRGASINTCIFTCTIHTHTTYIHIWGHTDSKVYLGRSLMRSSVLRVVLS